MKLYEIDAAMEALIDQDTGEIADWTEFENLQIARDQKIASMIAWHENIDAEELAISEKRKELQARENALKKQKDRLMSYIEFATSGAPYKCVYGEVVYRKSEAVIVADTDKFIEWAQKERDYLLRFKPPEIDKTAIKNAIKSGETIKYAVLEQRQNCSIKKYKRENE